MPVISYTAVREILTAHQQAELVTNGDFATDTVWNKGAGWAIASGVASAAAGSASDLDQSTSAAVGTSHILKFDMLNRTVGSITPKLGTAAGTARSANGTWAEYIVPAGSGSVIFTKDSAFDGDIDNVSLLITDQWDIEFAALGQNEPQREADVKFSRSMSGLIVSNHINAYKKHLVTTDYIAEADLDAKFWNEFLASTESHEQFSFDAKGTIASPDNPILVYREGRAFPQRVNGSNYFTITMTLVEVV